MSAPRLSFGEVHAALANRWPETLARLGIDDSFLTSRHGPCPMCGGKDRWRFTNYRQRGDWICNGCGNGDGFNLLASVFGWSPSRALREVIDAAGLASTVDNINTARGKISDRKSFPSQRTEPDIAQPSRRVRDLLRTSCAPSDVLDVVRYLKSRSVWPLPKGCPLRAHVGVDYYDGDDHQRIGRYPAIVAPVVDIDGALVTAHVTYLERGQKLAGHEPRKFFGKLTGRRGCAVRLAPVAPVKCSASCTFANVVGIAEGIETALAARLLHGVPVWAALNAGLLAKFEPPPGVEHVVIFCDGDRAGLEAAWHLRDRLGVSCELRPPPLPSKDWNDELVRDTQRA